MKTTGMIILTAISSLLFGQESKLTDIQKNSELFTIECIDGEEIIAMRGNQYDSSIDPFTGMEKGNSRGAKVILTGEKQSDCILSAEMKFLKLNLEDCEGCGWFGFVIRAQDFDNFEAVWFMPGMENENVAYIPFAHGVAPYWSEGYLKSEKGSVQLPKNDWFRTKVFVKGKEIFVYVNDELVLEKKLSYYLKSGFMGFFAGTATDVAFRRVDLKGL